MLAERIARLLKSFKAQSRKVKLFWITLTIIAAVSVLSLSVFLMVWSGALGELPTQSELAKVKNPVSSQVYSADSVLLGTYYIQDRSDVGFEDIPPFLIDELLATEDVRFYEHKAFDIKSWFRVLVKTLLLRNESSGGGSTLTQQLAKNLYPRKTYWLFSLPINKIREVIIASRIESVYTKNEIIGLYLNTVSFGDNTYGVQAASIRFYSRPVNALSVDEGAVLVGMLKATHTYNPRLFPQRAQSRRNVVLQQLEKYGKITKMQYDSLSHLPIQLSYHRITHHSGLAPYFREYIRQDLLAWCKAHARPDGSPYNLYTDGLKIYTTIDSRMQQFAEAAMTRQMELVQKSFDQQWRKRKPWQEQPSILDDAIKKTTRYRLLSEGRISGKEFNTQMSTPVEMNVFTWEGEKEVKMTPLDSIKHYLLFLNGGILAMDPEQGAVKVWVGGIDHHYFQYDHVRTTTKRQVGSTFKPIVYAAALEQGAQPCEFTSAEKVTYTNMDHWTPENANHQNDERKFSMEGALAFSVNTVSVKILEKAGITNVIQLAHKMGISSDMPAVPSLALGVANISMTELATAYSCIANGGNSIKPYTITAITNSSDELIEAFNPALHQKILSEETSQIMIHMLKRTINEGTASTLRSRYGIINDVAGKTGTTQSNADGWFMAITPKLVIGAWVGADDQRIRFRSTSLGQGSRTALPLVADFFQQLNRERTLDEISSAQFTPLSDELESRLSCALFKADKNFIEKIFGKKERKQQRDFGTGKKKKKGFFNKLFNKS